MSRTARQYRLDRAIARVLANCGAYLLPQSALIDEVGLLVTAPRPAQSEVEESIKHHDSSGRLTGIQGETETKWKLSDAGRAWHQENA